MNKLARFLLTVFSFCMVYAFYLAANVMGAVDKAAAAPLAQAESNIDSWLATYGPTIFGIAAVLVILWLIWFAFTVARMKKNK